MIMIFLKRRSIVTPMEELAGSLLIGPESVAKLEDVPEDLVSMVETLGREGAKRGMSAYEIALAVILLVAKKLNNPNMFGEAMATPLVLAHLLENPPATMLKGRSHSMGLEFLPSGMQRPALTDFLPERAMWRGSPFEEEPPSKEEQEAWVKMAEAALESDRGAAHNAVCAAWDLAQEILATPKVKPASTSETSRLKA